MSGRRLRDEFPALEGLCYLNAAGEGPLPRRAVAALERTAAEKERPAEVTGRHYYGIPAAVRDRIARLLNAAPAEIALTGSTSAGVGLVAREIPLRSGAEILVLEGQFPANLFPWAAAVRRGAVLRRVPLPAGGSPLRALRSAFGSRTALVAIDWVGFASGVRAEIDEIGELCRARDAAFFLDAAQGVGVLSLDVRAVPVDFVAAPGHKWLLGPPGTGFLYVAGPWIERMQPWNAGWVNLAERHGFRNLLRIPGDPPPDATRFECGTPPFVQLAAWLESLDLLLAEGIERIERRVTELAAGVRHVVREVGLRPVSPDGPPLASPLVLATAGERTAGIWRRLASAGVVAALREGALRFSPHLYNDESDLERLGAALRAAAGSGGGKDRVD